MYNSISYDDANQNHEIPIHTHYSGCSKEKKKMDRNKYWWGYGEIESSDIADDNVKWCSPLGKQSGSFSKLSIELLFDQQFCSSCIPKRNENLCLQKHLHIKVYNMIIRNRHKVETTQLSIIGWMDERKAIFQHYGILSSHKKEGVSDIGYNVKDACITLNEKKKKKSKPQRRLYIVWLHLPKMSMICRTIDPESQFIHGCLELGGH